MFTFFIIAAGFFHATPINFLTKNYIRKEAFFANRLQTIAIVRHIRQKERSFFLLMPQFPTHINADQIYSIFIVFVVRCVFNLSIKTMHVAYSDLNISHRLSPSEKHETAVDDDIGEDLNYKYEKTSHGRVIRCYCPDHKSTDAGDDGCCG